MPPVRRVPVFGFTFARCLLDRSGINSAYPHQNERGSLPQTATNKKSNKINRSCLPGSRHYYERNPPSPHLGLLSFHTSWMGPCLCYLCPGAPDGRVPGLPFLPLLPCCGYSPGPHPSPSPGPLPQPYPPPVVATPEPTSLLLFITGSAVLLLFCKIPPTLNSMDTMEFFGSIITHPRSGIHKPPDQFLLIPSASRINRAVTH